MVVATEEEGNSILVHCRLGHVSCDTMAKELRSAPDMHTMLHI